MPLLGYVLMLWGATTTTIFPLVDHIGSVAHFTLGGGLILLSKERRGVKKNLQKKLKTFDLFFEDTVLINHWFLTLFVFTVCW